MKSRNGKTIDDLDHARDDGVDPAAEVAGERGPSATPSRPSRASRGARPRATSARRRAGAGTGRGRGLPSAPSGEQRRPVVPARARVRRRADVRPRADRRAATAGRRRRRRCRSGRARGCARRSARATNAAKSRKMMKPTLGEREPVAPEADPDELPVAARLDLVCAALVRLERDLDRRRPSPARVSILVGPVLTRRRRLPDRRRESVTPSPV